MENKQKLGFVGSAVLFFGVFTPVISVPFIGNINYLHAYKASAIVVLLLAIASLGFAYLKKYKYLMITGIASLGLVLANFFYLLSEKSSTTSTEQLKGNPFAELGKALEEAVKQSIQIEWGWLILIAGSLIIIAAAVIKEQALQRSTSSELSDESGSESQ